MKKLKKMAEMQDANQYRQDSQKLFQYNAAKEIANIDGRNQYYQGVNAKMNDRAQNFTNVKIPSDFQYDSRKAAMQAHDGSGWNKDFFKIEDQLQNYRNHAERDKNNAIANDLEFKNEQQK